MAGRGRKPSSSSDGDSSPSVRAPRGKSTGGSGQGSSLDACNLTFRTPLQGLNSTVVSKLKTGDELTVELIEGNPYPSVVCRDPKTGKVAGALGAFSKIADLIECIRQGNSYLARVADLKIGCVVQIFRHAAPGES